MNHDEGYLLDNRQEEAGTRFDALALIFNPSTFRHIESLGISKGWRCWEVGAGGPSVPTCLAERVGPRGRVLATDIDVSWLSAAAGCGFEVRRHNVGSDDPPAETFDLVHARLVLAHVVQRLDALRSMVTRLRPGEWLLLEEADPALQPLICPTSTAHSNGWPTSCAAVSARCWRSVARTSPSGERCLGCCVKSG